MGTISSSANKKGSHLRKFCENNLKLPLHLEKLRRFALHIPQVHYRTRDLTWPTCDVEKENLKMERYLGHGNGRASTLWEV